MRVITETEERTTRTPTAVMTGLAGPSQGSSEVSTWHVTMEAGAESPVHLIDRDQVWMPVSGTFAFTVDGERADVPAGHAIVVPAGEVRQFRTVGGPAAAFVAMRADGRAGLRGDDVLRPIPWAV